jgi:hypothetical protein
MTLAQAREHSIAQLKLLRAAARRVRANEVLGSMHAAYAAFAAVMAKGGARVFDKLQSELRKIAES